MKKIFGLFFLLFIFNLISYAQEDASPAAQVEPAYLPVEVVLTSPFVNQEAARNNYSLFAMLINSTVQDPDLFRRMELYPIEKGEEPDDLVPIDEVPAKVAGMRIKESAKQHILTMFADARRDNVLLRLVSAFRSFDQQGVTKKRRGKWAAKQGYSQHGIGVAIDVGHMRKGSFKGTREAAWMAANCQKYGFVLTYDKPEFFEPWHFRYFGRDGVTLMNKFFYGDWRGMLIFVHDNQEKLPLDGRLKAELSLINTEELQPQIPENIGEEMKALAESLVKESPKYKELKKKLKIK